MEQRPKRSARHAVTTLARAEGRRHLPGLITLMLVVLLVTAGVLTAAAGARRSASAFDRFLRWSNAPTAEMGVVWPQFANDPAAVRALGADIAALDGVRAVRAEVGYGLFVSTKYDFILIVPASDREPDIGRPIVTAGRLPDPTAPDEVTINEIAAADLGLGVGDVLSAPVVRPEAWDALFRGDGGALQTGLAEGLQVDLRVVGITRDEASLSAGSEASPTARGTPAFDDAHPDAGAIMAAYNMSADHARFDGEAARASGRQAYGDGDGEVWYGEADDRGPTRTAFRWVATGLAIFALVALVAGVLAVLQTVSRQVQLSQDATRTGAALGMSRRDLATSVALPTGAAVLAGVLVGTAVALALSPRFPISVARRAEVDPGVRVDAVVHAGGAAALTAVFLGAVIMFAARSTRRRSSVVAPNTSAWARVRSRLHPPAAYGSSAVLDLPATRRCGVHPWTALAGATVALAGVTAILVFESSRSEAATQAHRFGWTWDVKPDLETADDMALVEQLSADPRLAAVGGVFCSAQTLADEVTPRCTITAVTGSIDATVLAGRAATSPSEVVLGQRTARRLGVGVGDQVELEATDGSSTRFTIVGIGAIPTVGEFDNPGRGVLLSQQGLEALVGGSVFEATDNQDLVLTVADGLDVETVVAELAAEYPLAFPAYAYAEPPELVQQLKRLRPSFAALAIFLAALGTLGLVHFLALSTRRRRGDFAVMQALGFVRRQVGSSVVWQGATIAAIGIVVGVPCGVIAGRAAWSRAVVGVGMDTRASVPVGPLVALVLATAAGVAGIAAVAGWRAALRRPATALRTE